MLTIMLWDTDLGYGITNNESFFEHTDEKTDNLRIWI